MQTASTYSLNIGGKLLELAEPQVMGILNVTPDSFYADSRQQTEQDIAERAMQIVREGASIIDVGACSTRPGAQLVGEEEELERLRTALRIVRQVEPDALLSVDTFRANVVERIANEFGSFIVNDVSGGTDPGMFPLVARLGLPYILTHNPSHSVSYAAIQSPFVSYDAIQSHSVSYAAIQSQPTPPLLPSLLHYLSERIDRLLELGQKDIILDPGFGFGKTLQENYQLMAQLDVLHTFGLPLLVGVSRKSMVYRLLDITPEDALNGTTVLHTLSLERGAKILRVHDVGTAMQVIKIMAEINHKS